MTRTEALSQIDEIRDTLPEKHFNNGALVSIIRDLYDGYPVSEAQATAARNLYLGGEYEAERQIKKIVAAIAE